MAEVDKYLGVEDIELITVAIKSRFAKFPNEDLKVTIAIVLLNFGEKYVEVTCIGGEWHGTKGDLEGGSGLPVCPNGHPLLEQTVAPRLALAREV